MGIIYLITNKINHKQYVGLTTQTIDKRWQQHIDAAYSNGKDANSIFKKAIRKYGKDNWELSEIDRAEDIEILKQKEIYWIKQLNTYAFDENSNGYNSTRGGDYSYEFNNIPIWICDILSGAIIKKCKSINEGSVFLNCRLEKNAIEMENRRVKGYCILFENNVINLSKEELINKIHNLYPYLVYQLTEDGKIIKLYTSSSEAAIATNQSQGNIIDACNGIRRLCNGYQWSYQKDIENKINKKVRDKKEHSIPVIQYSMGGMKIREWSSAREAMKANKANESHINSCCNLTRSSAGGFQWRYASDNIDKLEPLFTNRQVKCIETNELFDSPNQAAKHFNYSQQTVKKSCMENGKSTKQFHFIWFDDLDQN